MTSVPRRYSPNVESWGCSTRDPEFAGRRIVVSNLSNRVSIKDLLKYFGTESRVHGITLFRHGYAYAFVQFKHPQDYTHALTLNDRYLDNGDRIKVSPFDPDRNRGQSSLQRRDHPSPPSRPVKRKKRSRSRSGGRSRSRSSSLSRSPRTTKSPRSKDGQRSSGSPACLIEIERERKRDRDRSRARSRTPRGRSRSSNRNRSPAAGRHEVRGDRPLITRETRERGSSMDRDRSRSRSCSHSPANRTDYRNNPVNLNLLNQGPENMASLLMNYNLETRARNMQTTFGGGINQSRTTFQSATVMNKAPGAPIENPHEKDLPSEIGLILKLVVEQGTAKKLSLANIQDVVNYFESTKLLILALSRPIPPNDTVLQNRQQFSQQTISGNDVQTNQVAICNELPNKAPTLNHSQSQSHENTESSNATATNGPVCSSTTKPLLEKLAELNRYNKKY